MAIVQPVASISGGRRKLSVANPATLEPIGEIDVHTAEDVRNAVHRAREAQRAWAKTSFDDRAKYLWRAVRVLLDRQEEFIDVICRDTGRSRFETLIMEIFPACDTLAYAAKNAKKTLADKKVSMHLMKTKKLLLTYRPLGVIGVITPWNGAFILGTNPTALALMAGNAVILKPTEVTPFAGRLVKNLFDAAGLPEGLVQVLDGDGETGAALIEGGVDKISFTGSVRTGRKVGEACGRNLIPCTLELGGKDPMIVCEDADLDRAAAGAVFGGMINAGQFCCSTERVYVSEKVMAEFTRKVVDKVKTLRQGTEGEFDMGPIIWPNQLETIERQVEDARQKGAEILTGGRRNPSLKGLFYEPTVMTNVNHDMAIMKEETFGPILPIVKVRDEEEALRMANDSCYGLSANVWTKNETKAITLAKRIDSGSVCVNDFALTYGAAEAPFGGMKTSGVGQVHGENGLKSYCFCQPIIIDRFGAKEEQVWFPYTAKKHDLIRKIMRWVWGTPIGKLMS
jgi:succinate-semialdehyde dehydrogenase/glutarate-semialdehyde dehydrogenase